MASSNLLFANLLMFTPPVGRCSALVLDGVFYAYFLFKQRKPENLFVFLYDKYMQISKILKVTLTVLNEVYPGLKLYYMQLSI